jgi:PilZ domain
MHRKFCLIAMVSQPAQISTTWIPLEGMVMATGLNPRRKEIRIPMKVLVELCSFENFTFELAYTVDVSSHGARVLTKNPWQSNQQMSVRSVQDNLYSLARVVYCQSTGDSAFAIGVEMREPTADWTKTKNH